MLIYVFELIFIILYSDGFVKLSLIPLIPLIFLSYVISIITMLDLLRHDNRINIPLKLTPNKEKVHLEKFLKLNGVSLNFKPLKKFSL